MCLEYLSVYFGKAVVYAPIIYLALPGNSYFPYLFVQIFLADIFLQEEKSMNPYPEDRGVLPYLIPNGQLFFERKTCKGMALLKC